MSQYCLKKRVPVPQITQTKERLKPCLAWQYFIPLYCIFISLLLFATRDLSAAQSAPIGLSNINRVICIPVAIVYTLIFFFTKQKMRKPNLPIKLFFIYIIIGALSSWLFSDWLLYSIWKLLEIIAVFLTILYAWDLDLKYPGTFVVFYQKIILFYKFLLLSVVASVLLMPSRAIHAASSVSDAFLPYRVSGPLFNINPISVGTISSFIIYILIVKFVHRRSTFNKTDFAWLSLSSILLIFAQSRTAIAGLLLALAILMLLNKNKSLLLKGSIVFIGGLTVYFFAGGILDYLQRGQSTQGIHSLSGRFTWWEFAYNKMLSSDLLHQLFGYGFAIGDRIMAVMSSGNRMQTLDSTYMSALVSSGFLGTIILVYMVIYTNTKLFFKARNNVFYLELFGLSLILGTKSLTTTTFNVFTMYTILFLVICVLANASNTDIEQH